MQTIAKIKLAAGHVGWYEPISRIHLTLSNPIAEIKAGTKLEGILKSISYGTVTLIEGSLEEDAIIETVNEQVSQAAKLKAAPEPEELIAETLSANQKEIQEDDKPKKTSKKKSKSEA